jgi:hypothetical protein
MLGTDYIADVYYDAACNEKHRELVEEAPRTIRGVNMAK